MLCKFTAKWRIHRNTILEREYHNNNVIIFFTIAITGFTCHLLHHVLRCIISYFCIYKPRICTSFLARYKNTCQYFIMCWGVHVNW